MKLQAIFWISALSLVWLVTGCSDDGTTTADKKEKAAPRAHADKGPHDGQLIELGAEEYHGEFLLDETNGSTTIYILDGSATKTVPIEATEVSINLKHDGQGKQFKLTASPTDDDGEGKSSRFVSAEKELAEDLHHHDADAKLAVIIDGKSYSGGIEHAH